MDAVAYLLFIIILILFGYHVYSIQFSTRRLPPGPFVLPFWLGNIPSAIFSHPTRPLFHKDRPWEYLASLKDKYGDIFSFEFAGFYVVTISSYDLLQEVANMEVYDNKAAIDGLTTLRTFDKELGLVFVSKPELWNEMRKFTQRTLRDFGFGKRQMMQSVIEAETSLLVKEFKEVVKTTGIIRIRTTFVLSLLNVLWCMVAGQRYEHDDPKLVQLLERNFAMTKSLTLTQIYELVIAHLRKKMPGVIPKDYKRIRVYDECHEFTQTLVEERKAEGVYKTHPENFIDVFLKKIEDAKNSNENDNLYTEEQLLAMLADLLQAGFITTNGTLNYAILYLILNKEMQRKCQVEIDSVVPSHLSPTLDDVGKMAYFQAFILETHRHANVLPTPMPRIVKKDCEIRGYKIPKGSFLESNHYAIHMDKRMWGDPEVFRPERFINEKGEFVMDKRVIHFGLGKRLCIGIALANSVIPIFIATLLQHFSFEVVPGTKPPKMEPEIGVTLSPVEFPVLVKNRRNYMQTRMG